MKKDFTAENIEKDFDIARQVAESTDTEYTLKIYQWVHLAHGTF